MTIFLDKQKLNKKSEGNSNSSVVSLELLHQLAASYFTDRESTLRRLHHLQIATSAIKVLPVCIQRVTKLNIIHTDAHLLSSCRMKISISHLCKYPVYMLDVDLSLQLCGWINNHSSWQTRQHYHSHKTVPLGCIAPCSTYNK